MTDVPVLFQPPMVDGIDAGRKTMTRRHAWRSVMDKLAHREIEVPSPWQNIKPGDRLWVREQHWRWGVWNLGEDDRLHFMVRRATLGDIFWGEKPPGRLGHRDDLSPGWHKRPSIFMPKEHSRFTLIVTATKIERLQDISAADARAEGIFELDHGGWHWERRDVSPAHQVGYGIAISAFHDLWSHINGEESWNANPEVVAVTFCVIKANIDNEAAFRDLAYKETA